MEELNDLLDKLNQQLNDLNDKKDALRQEEQKLTQAINNDEVGRQIKELTESIKELEITKQLRIEKRNSYDDYARKLELEVNPTEQAFDENRAKASKEKQKCTKDVVAANEELRTALNTKERIEKEIQENKDALNQLKKNDNNISGKEAEIRDMILEAVGASSKEIPFIGEIIRVKDDERKWENSIEKITKVC